MKKIIITIDECEESDELILNSFLQDNDFEYECKWESIKPTHNKPLTGSETSTQSKSCNVCGSGLVEIRGRYPKQPKRTVCATCAVEKLEYISEYLQPEQVCKST